MSHIALRSAIGAAAVAGVAVAFTLFRAHEAATPRAETCWNPDVVIKVRRDISAEFFSQAPQAFGEARETPPDGGGVGKRLWVSLDQLHPVSPPTEVGIDCAASVDLRFMRGNDAKAHFDGQVLPYQVRRGQDGWLVTFNSATVGILLRQALERGSAE